MPMRFTDLTKLKSAAQELALRKWNSSPRRPAWDRNGLLLQRVCPGPVDVDSLYYLAEQARPGLRERFERAARYSKAERAAVRSVRALHKWIAEAKRILATLRASDHGGGPAIFVLKRLFEPDGLELSQLEIAAKFGGNLRLDRTDQTRFDLVHDTVRELQRNEAEVTAPVIACASLLCGLFPEGLRITRKGVTAAEVLQAERRLIARVLLRYPTPGRTRK